MVPELHEAVVMPKCSRPVSIAPWLFCDRSGEATSTMAAALADRTPCGTLHGAHAEGSEDEGALHGARPAGEVR